MNIRKILLESEKLMFMLIDYRDTGGKNKAITVKAPKVKYLYLGRAVRDLYNYHHKKGWKEALKEVEKIYGNRFGRIVVRNENKIRYILFYEK